MHVYNSDSITYGSKFRRNIEKLIGFYWKYKESNISQYIFVYMYRNTVKKHRNISHVFTFFLYRDTPKYDYNICEKKPLVGEQGFFSSESGSVIRTQSQCQIVVIYLNIIVHVSFFPKSLEKGTKNRLPKWKL